VYNLTQRITTGSILLLVVYASVAWYPALFTALCITATYQLIFNELPVLAVAHPPLTRTALYGYVVVSFFCLLLLNELAALRPLLYALLSIVPLFDTAAYIIGSLVGKHRMIPSISPSKTWEGSLGALGVCLIVASMYSYFMLPESLWWRALIGTALLCLAAFAGDLFESYLKRCAHVKDSGNLLPGHGGIFDRMDSILAGALFMYGARMFLLPLFSN
jgi:phosphatidate cytidylyltransferase